MQQQQQQGLQQCEQQQCQQQHQLHGEQLQQQQQACASSSGYGSAGAFALGGKRCRWADLGSESGDGGDGDSVAFLPLATARPPGDEPDADEAEERDACERASGDEAEAQLAREMRDSYLATTASLLDKVQREGVKAAFLRRACHSYATCSGLVASMAGVSEVAELVHTRAAGMVAWLDAHPHVGVKKLRQFFLANQAGMAPLIEQLV